jgi:hypothetical protein
VLLNDTSASDATKTVTTQAIANLKVTELSEDTTPQLGGNLDVNGNSIVSASNGDINITPNGTGNVVLDGLKWPQSDGTANYVLKTDGAGQLSWTAGGGGSTNSFETIAVAGQSNVVADSSTDTLTLAAGSGITITTNASTDTVTIAASGGGSGALSFISSQSASASAALSFTSLGDYAYVEFVLIDILPATDDVELWMETSTDNGSTYDTGATDYKWAHMGRTGGTSQEVATTDSAIRLCQGAVGLDVSNVTDEGVSGTVKLYNPTSAAYKRMTYQIGFMNGNGGGATYSGSGVRMSAADVDAIRFKFSSGNIASGTIYAYGLSKT